MLTQTFVWDRQTRRQRVSIYIQYCKFCIFFNFFGGFA